MLREGGSVSCMCACSRWGGRCLRVEQLSRWCMKFPSFRSLISTSLADLLRQPVVVVTAAAVRYQTFGVIITRFSIARRGFLRSCWADTVNVGSHIKLQNHSQTFFWCPAHAEQHSSLNLLLSFGLTCNSPFKYESCVDSHKCISVNIPDTLHWWYKPALNHV